MTAPESPNGPASDKEERLFILDHKPDALELTIRATCGGLLGLLLATYVWYRTGLISDPVTVSVLYVVAVAASAFFAAKLGDGYWEGVSNFFRRSP